MRNFILSFKIILLFGILFCSSIKAQTYPVTNSFGTTSVSTIECFYGPVTGGAWSTLYWYPAVDTLGNIGTHSFAVQDPQTLF